MSSNYFKNKQNCKLKVKFFCLFQVLHPVDKQAYKLKLPKKYKIYNIFYVLLLEQNIIKEGQINNTQLEFKASDNKEYKFESISDRAIDAKELAEIATKALLSGHMEKLL